MEDEGTEASKQACTLLTFLDFARCKCVLNPIEVIIGNSIIDGDINGKICFNRHGINHVVESRFFGANRLGINSGKSSSWPSESSRPQPLSLSPKESNTYDDVAVNQSNDVFKVKTAEGSDETPSRSFQQ